MAKTGIIVIDPGHGGKTKIGDSSPNNAVSASGVLEKNITLRLAFLVRDQLNKLEPDVKVVMTRDTDVNVGLAARAKVAKTAKADLLLSLHCNGFDKKTRGTETLIAPPAQNSKNAADRVYAQKIQNAAFGTLKKFDAKANDRGVKDQSLAVLRDSNLGKDTRGCMIELEFIDVKAVDELLNIGPESPKVREELAKALAKALIVSL